jgi:hypothetical protein
MKSLSVKNFNENFLDLFLTKYNLLKKKKKNYIYTFFCLSFSPQVSKDLTFIWANSSNYLLIYLFLIILKIKLNLIRLPIKDAKHSERVYKIQFLNS